jgi:hypothetical protein
VSDLRRGLDMDVIRIRQSDHGPRIYAQPVRELGMRLRDIGQALMDHADDLDPPDVYELGTKVAPA